MTNIDDLLVIETRFLKWAQARGYPLCGRAWISGQTDRALRNGQSALKEYALTPTGYVHYSLCFDEITPVNEEHARGLLRGGLPFYEDLLLVAKTGVFRSWDQEALSIDTRRNNASAKFFASCSTPLEQIDYAKLIFLDSNQEISLDEFDSVHFYAAHPAGRVTMLESLFEKMDSLVKNCAMDGIVSSQRS